MLIDILARTYAPYLCVGCGEEGKTLLCDSCLQDVIPVPPRCYRCKKVSRGSFTCTDCKKHSPLSQVLVFAVYEGSCKELVHSYKYERAQGACLQLSAMLASLLSDIDDEYILTEAPTATSRVRQRGYDHARLLAKKLAHSARKPYASLLARTGQPHQVGADRKQRLAQVKNTFRVVRPSRIAGKHILLVDDIVTTGATLEEAARTLKRAGAARVSAIVVAQP